jgi:hypothetical protein
MPLSEENKAILIYWQTHSQERAKAQTVAEWLREYETGRPVVTRRLVVANPIVL